MACKDCNDDCHQGRKCPVPHNIGVLPLVLTAVILASASVAIIFCK